MKLNGLEMPKKVFQALLSMDEGLPNYGEKIKNEKSLILSKKSFSKFVNEVEDAITKDPKIEESKKLSLLNSFSKYEEDVNFKFDKEDSESEDEDEKKKKNLPKRLKIQKKRRKGKRRKILLLEKEAAQKKTKKKKIRNQRSQGKKQ